MSETEIEQVDVNEKMKGIEREGGGEGGRRRRVKLREKEEGIEIEV